MKCSSKELKKDYYFVVYDHEDNIYTYVDSIDALSNIISKCLRNIVVSFNNTDNQYINILINGKKYKLYAFKEEN